ncbi:MAG: tyrosine-type recombinase/integrase [Lachnospiraceae bacterium]|nr:tyrosine-type recombinase/integrase [Lachnospiraceae bacterium]
MSNKISRTSDKNEITTEQLLRFAVENGILNLTSVKAQMEEMKNEQILASHQQSIWHNEKEGYYYCCLPDQSKKSGWRNVKRRKREDIENVLIEFYSTHEEENVQNVFSDPKPKARTVEELFWEFLEYKKQLVKPATIVRMQSDWERFYTPHPEFIRKSYKQLKKTDIDLFFNSVVNEHSLKDKAFHNMCGILKQTLQYAVDSEYMEESPYRVNINKKKIVHQRKTSGTGQIYTPEEKEKLIVEMEHRLANNPDSTAPLAVMLDFELGLRKGEILALAKSDIQDGRIHIHKQVVEKFDVSDLKNIRSVGFEVVSYVKSEDGDRWLPLTKRAQDIIDRILKINERRGDGYGDFFFVREGHILSPDAIDAQMRRGCQYIGIQVKTMHKIRKTYGSQLYNNGVSLSTVKTMLGHADETTTLKYYIYDTHEVEERDQAVLAALEAT